MARKVRRPHNETRFWYIRWIFGLVQNEDYDNPHVNDPDILLPVPVITVIGILITILVATIGVFVIGGKNEVYSVFKNVGPQFGHF